MIYRGLISDGLISYQGLSPILRGVRTSLVAQRVKRLSTMQEIQVLFLGWEDPLEEEMAPHSSILAFSKHAGRTDALESVCL